MVFAAVFCGFYHTLDSALAKAAGNNDSGAAGELFCDIFGVHALAVNPVNLDVRTVGIARMAKRFRNGKVRVVKLNIFAHKTDIYGFVAVNYAVNHLFPFRKIKIRRVDIKLAAYDFRKTVFFKHKRSFIKHRHGDIFNYTFRLYVAEKGNFFEDGGLQRGVAAKHYHIGVNSHALQLLDGMLGGL